MVTGILVMGLILHRQARPKITYLRKMELQMEVVVEVYCNVAMSGFASTGDISGRNL